MVQNHKQEPIAAWSQYPTLSNAEFKTHLETLQDHGFCLFEDTLSPTRLSEARDALYEAAAEDEVKGTAYRYDNNDANQRVWALLNRGQVFVDLIQHPLALRFLEQMLGERFLLSNISANITGPGAGPMHLHADQGYVDPPWPEDKPLALNIMWVIDEFTASNGGTRYVEKSHLRCQAPDPLAQYETRVMEAPAGTMIVMDGRLWHQTGPNTHATQTRAGIFAYYVRPFLRTQENWFRSLQPDLLQNLTPLLEELLGFNHYKSLGIVNGMPLEGPRF